MNVIISCGPTMTVSAILLLFDRLCQVLGSLLTQLYSLFSFCLK